MISNIMKELVGKSSVIRAMFEEGKRLAALHGAENVYDFSLGNPNTPPPQKLADSLVEIVKGTEPMKLHGYMSNSGFEDVRKTVADNLNGRFATSFTAGNIIMTVGAAGGLNVVLKSLLNPEDEVVVFAPYFGEYANYVANFNGKLAVVEANPPTFLPDMEAFAKKLTTKTKAVIVNTPNNPTGVIYDEATIKALAAVLKQKQAEYGTQIYLISDEPYRELAYDGVEVPYITKYYANTIVGYSYSKSLSLPGERIGYLVIPNECADFEELVGACNVATRILGFVNAPALFQLAVAKCIDSEVDMTQYCRNRELLLENLTKMGFECVKPQGAFYLFVKTPVDDKKFCEMAKGYNLLLVPGSAFGCAGYARIAYCVATDMIERSLPAFEKLSEDLKLK